MAVFRTHHIQPNTIAMIPLHGYANKINFSIDSIRWLDYVSHSEKIHIRHALNGSGEVKIGRHFVDGFCESSETIYQYHVSLILF